MTQPAQSSGHEWVQDDGRIHAASDAVAMPNSCAMQRKAVHVASAAQAAQPQEVPAEQRQRTSTIAMGKMKPTELMAHEISLPEGELEHWYENPAAQPASAAKPANPDYNGEEMKVLQSTRRADFI